MDPSVTIEVKRVYTAGLTIGSPEEANPSQSKARKKEGSRQQCGDKRRYLMTDKRLGSDVPIAAHAVCPSASPPRAFSHLQEAPRSWNSALQTSLRGDCFKMSSKSALKEVRTALDSKNFELAAEKARDLVKEQPQNYHA